MTNRIYLQITSGRGPVECCRAVVLVLEKILKQANRLNIKSEVLEREVCDVNSTLASVVIALEGAKSEEIVDEWEGTIQWIAESPYRIHHKRKNWFIGVKSFIISPLTKIDTRYIIYQTLRSSGPGGQHVNKTESAVRAIHAPSGISVTASDQRSQLQNKKLATERLLIKIMEWNEEQLMRTSHKNWNNHNNLQRGNPVKIIQESLK